jgi:hypothetical protein
MITNINQEVEKESSYISVYTWGCIFLCITTMVIVATLAIIRPESGSTITIILGMSLPVITGLLGAALKDISKGINGRMSQLLDQKDTKTESEMRSSIIRDLNTKLNSFEPGSPEYLAILEQIKLEAVKHFDIKERRMTKQ